MSNQSDEEKCDEEEEEQEDEAEWEIWTNPLEELSEIEKGFEASSKNKLHGKTILDVGTDCVKPLYIALKLEPNKVVGINEDLAFYPFASELEQNAKHLTRTKIRLRNCSLFNDEKLKRIRTSGG